MTVASLGVGRSTDSALGKPVPQPRLQSLPVAIVETGTAIR